MRKDKKKENKVGLIKEFREFAVKGNVVDMAVGIIIGGAFGKIVSSVVADVVMPPIGLILGGVDFRDLKITLAQATQTSPAVTLNYGIFFQTVIDFLIIAAAVFFLVKAINTIRRTKEEAPPPAEEPKEIALLGEIRDLLKSK